MLRRIADKVVDYVHYYPQAFEELYFSQASVLSALSATSGCSVPSFSIGRLLSLCHKNLLLPKTVSSVQHQKVMDVAFSAPLYFHHETFFVAIRRKMNVANNRIFRRLYEIGPLHLNKCYPLPPQISVFWKLMHSMACFVPITAKLNYIAFYHNEDVVPFQKKLCKHVLISQRVQERPLAFDNQGSIRDFICKIA